MRNTLPAGLLQHYKGRNAWDLPSGVARAFPGGRLAHPEGQTEEENE